MDETRTTIDWWEPQWSWVAASSPILKGWGLLSPWMWFRLLVIGLGGAAIGLYLIHRTAPNIPFPPGLIRAVIVGGLCVPAMLLINLTAFLWAPVRVEVGPRGIVWTRTNSHLIESERIVCAHVASLGDDRFVLSVQYTTKRGNPQRRDFGLSRKVDPIDLEQLLLTLGWPAPEPERN